MHTHMCKYKHTHNQKKKKICNHVCLNNHSVQITSKNQVCPPPPPPQADHLFWLVQPYYKILTYMIFMNIPTEEEEKKKK